MEGYKAKAAQRISQEVIETLQRDGAVNVVIAITEPTSMAALRKETPQANMSTLKHEIAELQDEVLSSLEASDYVERIRYEAVPALALKIMTESGLAKLAANPNVVRIDLDIGGAGKQK